MDIGENGTFQCIMDAVLGLGNGNIAILDSLINIAALIFYILDMAFGVGEQVY